MRIVSLKLQGYRQYLEETELIVPEGLTGICGPNGVGKSKLIEAIGYALYGPRSSILPTEDTSIDLISKGGTAPLIVSVVLELNRELYEIKRSQRETFIRLQNAKDNLAETPTGVTKKVIELLRLTPKTFQGTFVARQRDVIGLLKFSPSERQKLVNRLIGITQVEEAAAISNSISINREKDWKAEIRHLDIASEVLLQELKDLENKLSAVEEQVKGLSIVVENSRATKQEAYAVLVEARRQISVLENKRQQFDSLTQSRSAWEGRLSRMRINIETSVQASIELADEQRVVRETEDIPVTLDFYNCVAKAEGLRGKRKTYELDLAQRITPLLQEHGLFQKEIEDLKAKARLMDRDVVVWEQKKARFSEEVSRLSAEINRFEQKKQTAINLGYSGTCDTCGQQFGDNLSHALTHYKDEIRVLRKQQDSVLNEVARAKTYLEEIYLTLEECNNQLERKQELYNGFETALKEDQRIKFQLDEIAKEFAVLSQDIRDSHYDHNQHEKLQRQFALRQQAEQRVLSLTPVVAQLENYKEEESQIVKELERIITEQAEVIVEIQRLSGIEDTISELEFAFAATEAAFEQANERYQEVSEDKVRLRVEIENKTTRVEMAKHQESLISSARFSFRVAERTNELLEQMLKEITSEAKPRLVEWIDTWARTLLGSRFRSIELSDDYSIRADNGSGLHSIHHFSGGEQTLLALMLRVAISLFCRERAGFDTGFLILDEIFGEQDGEHRVQLVQFLSEIKEFYHQILVVNHIEDVTAMLDTIIDVIPTGPNTSVARHRP